MLFEYPAKAAFNRIVPKAKFYERSKPTKAVREKFVSQIGQVIWSFKLAPETINLPARDGISEIQVFSIAAKSQDLGIDVLRCIDRSVPSPIIFEIGFNNAVKVVAAYKRQSDADSSGWVVEQYFESEWILGDTKRKPLPIALDMSVLYEQLLLPLINLPQRQQESLRQLVERVGVIRSRQHEQKKLEARLIAEKQFNRKVELNSHIRTIQSEIESLLAASNKD